MRILVTGGTGLLGSRVVSRLVDAGHQVLVASRKAGAGRVVADLKSGVGVREAVAGVDAVVHCATAFGRRSETRLAATLVDAALRAGRPHLVYVSIVGADRVPLGYYQEKVATERLIERSGLPWTVLRATQFHDLLRVLLVGAARVPLVMPVPDCSFQPVDVGEVADRVAELAVGAPAGRVPDIAGPEIRRARDLAELVLAAAGRRRVLLAIRLPGKAFRGYRRGGHLAADRRAGRITFAEHLAAHPALRNASYRGRS
ncbi:SDR family oxidoreductase [Kibdelosporangium phytohabitans]|uniref:NAD(P)-binding domain-containing protein n=1 Tax=Kibdelosporangium phytohabitans TaxID=860235 RepID=A0A0N9HTI7_9PSEU|nr:NAD(P)H-binding protein [Kibdelosporangium phytohabitans]ALG06712.1 hypothetical protein AOZ06_07020 [Kibdelosporangium phytohabitans]MBE1467934.1 uncharacterized protein YbjT (DUF2867 family) [Kibdelosporangium phytohabitans]